MASLRRLAERLLVVAALCLGKPTPVHKAAPAAHDACDDAPPLVSFAGAFTAAECERIEKLFEARADVEVDERPAFGISRRNRWLPRSSWGDFAWVVERVLERRPASDAAWQLEAPVDADAFLEKHVEFVLMHEFREGAFFDWHVDAHPDDSKRRTMNVNVALTDPATFEGGALQVGAANATLRRGDLYVYPASYPHKVHDVAKGFRRTLVLATRRATETADDGAAAAAYWRAAAARYEALCASLGDAHPKLHWIFGEFLEKTGDADGATRKFADSYRATPERAAYARSFADAAAEKHEGGDLAGAVDDLYLASLVEPDEAEFRADLGVLRWRAGDLAAAEAELRAALALEDNAGLRAALSLVLRDAGRADDAARERRKALDADEDSARAALEALE